MSMPTYVDALREAYEGEIEGEAVYRRLAELSVDSEQRKKLVTIADVEQRTHRILHAAASRLGIDPAMEGIAAKAARRAIELNRLAWREFIAKATVDWPPYIERFEAVERMAPVVDALAARRLVEHERALVAFVRLELQHSHESLRPLHDFLASTRGEAVQ
ncbi:MAG: hypothetical protein JWN43_3937 [Gammaproteobacteria bacterium]|nr:hypothetical protein [Gammaproteobacteria bacterium]